MQNRVHKLPNINIIVFITTLHGFSITVGIIIQMYRNNMSPWNHNKAQHTWLFNDTIIWNEDNLVKKLLVLYISEDM